MPQSTRKRKPFNLDEAQRLHEQGLSYRKVAAALGSNYAAVRRALNAAHDASAPGSPGSPGLPTPIVYGELIGEPIGSPRLDDLESHVNVLEAFIATLQQQGPNPTLVSPAANSHVVLSL
jgi:hypothetical protein